MTEVPPPSKQPDQTSTEIPTETPDETPTKTLSAQVAPEVPAAPAEPVAATATWGDRLRSHRAAIAVGLASVIIGGLGGFALGHAVGDNDGRDRFGGPGGFQRGPGMGRMNGQMGPGGVPGQVPPGQVPQGQVPQGQVPQGQVPQDQQGQQGQSTPPSGDGDTDSSSLRTS